MKRAERLKQKRERAEKQQAQWSSLSIQQQIADLDRRLGKGQGATKQRARLAALLEAEKAEKKAKKVAKKD
jgi:ribosomal protein S12 methylthiotransferase accessory factor YcaO